MPHERVSARAGVTPRYYMTLPCRVKSFEVHIHFAISKEHVPDCLYRCRVYRHGLLLGGRLDNSLWGGGRLLLKTHPLSPGTSERRMGLTRESSSPGGSLCQPDAVQVLTFSLQGLAFRRRLPSCYTSRATGATRRGFRPVFHPVGVEGFLTGFRPDFDRFWLVLPGPPVYIGTCWKGKGPTTEAKEAP